MKQKYANSAIYVVLQTQIFHNNLEIQHNKSHFNYKYVTRFATYYTTSNIVQFKVIRKIYLLS